MNWSSKSIAGRRENNEDSCRIFYRENEALLLVVADGMGGHLAGEVASAIAVDTIEACFKTEPAFSSPEKFLINAADKANLAVYRRSENDKRYAGMGTTLVMALIINDILYVANIGDSRLYLYHNNVLHQVTKDHAFIQELIDKGLLTEYEAKLHPLRHMITRSVGNRLSTEADLFEYPLSDMDIVLLCSDGLSGALEPDRISDILSNNSLSPDQLSKALVDAAFEAQSDDNITACLYIHDTEAVE